MHAFLHSTDINSECLSGPRYGPKFRKQQPIQPCLPLTSCSLSEKTLRERGHPVTKDGDAELRGLWEQMAGAFTRDFSQCFWKGNGILLPVSLPNI